jgi:hypothetical protein
MTAPTNTLPLAPVRLYPTGSGFTIYGSDAEVAGPILGLELSYVEGDFAGSVRVEGRELGAAVAALEGAGETVQVVGEPAVKPGLVNYYPEMGQLKPEAQIEANLGHYGKHWYLWTPLTLAGRGIEYQETGTADTLVPGSKKVGWHRYKVTCRAFELLQQKYAISSESLL